MYAVQLYPVKFSGQSDEFNDKQFRWTLCTTGYNTI